MYCRIFLLQRKPKLGGTKPSTGPRVEHRWLRIRPMGLAIAEVANQSETMSQISYCVIAKSHIVYITVWMGTHEHNPSFTHLHVLLS